MNPSRILDLANAFWGSAALLSANECGVFGAVAQRPATAAELAAELQLPERSLANLLDALVALELLTRDGEGRYANTAEAQAFLVPDRPGSLAGALRYNAAMFPAWSRLTESVRTNEPVVEPPSYLGKDKQATRIFVHGMHRRALAMGHALAGSMDLSGATHLVDVAGGPGTLSVLLCQKYPGLRATVLELPGIAEVGRELVADAGLGDRVTFRDADVLTEDLGSGYDAALVSGFLHREPAATAQTMCERLFEATKPGARVYLIDVMRDESRVGPAFAALFALNMMLSSERGGCHADIDHIAWLERAGFTGATIKRLPPPMMHTLVGAIRS